MSLQNGTGQKVEWPRGAIPIPRLTVQRSQPVVVGAFLNVVKQKCAKVTFARIRQHHQKHRPCRGFFGHFQGSGERGIAGVRLVTARGLAATTDTHGRYHITCAITPNESRGSNFALKIDDRSLPSGFRASTRPVQIQRATRGKALKINFGASIHRVVGLDIADAVFEPGTVEMRHQWLPRISLLINELRKAPSVLRLSYVADVEDESLVEQRLEALKEMILDAWQEENCCYELVVESEIFWRLGGPPERPRETASGVRQ